MVNGEALTAVPLGDSAFLLRFSQTAGDSEQALRLILQTAERLRAAALPGVIEIAPAFASVGVFFDPTTIAAAVKTDSPGEWLRARMMELAKEATASPMQSAEARAVEIPVCYDKEFALDLELVAEHAGIPIDEAVEQHAAGDYLVQCVGFTPGFPYLSGLPATLATPRRASPRTLVPMGSVAIGGTQTGVYPVASPGGWNVIGRTPLSLFDVSRNPPALLQAGDRVRFRRITREEFSAFHA